MEQDSKRGRGKTRDSLGFPHRSSSRYPSRRVQKESSPDAQKPKLNTPQGNQPLNHSSSIEDSKCARKFPLHPKKPTPNTPQKLHSSSSDSAATLIEAAGSTKKNGHGTYTPGDSDSPPTSDDPPEDLLWELTDLDRNSSGDSKATDTEEPRVSFWDFVSTHSPEYRGNVGPLPRTPRGKSRVRWNRPVSVSTRVTNDGTIVMEGFAGQIPTTSRAVLKVRPKQKKSCEYTIDGGVARRLTNVKPSTRRKLNHTKWKSLLNAIKDSKMLGRRRNESPTVETNSQMSRHGTKLSWSPVSTPRMAAQSKTQHRKVRENLRLGKRPRHQCPTGLPPRSEATRRQARLP